MSKDKAIPEVPQDPEEETQLSFEGMIENGSTTPAQDLPAEPEAEGVELTNALSTYRRENINFAPEDVLIPRLRLAQGLTQEVQDGAARPGNWVMTGFEAAPELTVVPLLFTRRRELTDPDFNILCRSSDGLTGVGNPGGNCAACPLNRWEDGPDGKRIPPKCTFIYSYIAYIVEHGALAMLDFKRTSIGAGKLINTMIATKGLGKFAVRLKSAAQKGGRGSFYTATVQPVTVDPEILMSAQGLI